MRSGFLTCLHDICQSSLRWHLLLLFVPCAMHIHSTYSHVQRLDVFADVSKMCVACYMCACGPVCYLSHPVICCGSMRLYICMYCSHDVGLMLHVHACLHVLFLLHFFSCGGASSAASSTVYCVRLAARYGLVVCGCCTAKMQGVCCGIALL